jgi:hypothetical protein
MFIRKECHGSGVRVKRLLHGGFPKHAWPLQAAVFAAFLQAEQRWGLETAISVTVAGTKAGKASLQGAVLALRM